MTQDLTQKGKQEVVIYDFHFYINTQPRQRTTKVVSKHMATRVLTYNTCLNLGMREGSNKKQKHHDRLVVVLEGPCF